MPHIIVEYSNNLETAVDVPSLLGDMHKALSAQGIDKARIKTRAIALEQSIVGEAICNEGHMAHITVQLLEGRDVETKKKYAEAVHVAAKSIIHAGMPRCSVTLEIRDMAAETYILG